MIYFTSDLHFGHDKAFIYEPRGFRSVSEHDHTIISLWNELISDEDDVYILGDLFLGDSEHGIHCLKQLHGKLHILFGNHDTPSRIEAVKQLENIEILGFAQMIRYRKQSIYLAHYPTITGNHSDDEHLGSRVLCFCGHTHSKERFYENNPYIYNAALDAHHNRPVSIEQILKEIRTAHQQRTQTTGS